MANNNIVKIILQAVDQASKEIGKVNGALRDIDGTGQKSTGRIEKFAAGVQGLTPIIGGAVAAGLTFNHIFTKATDFGAAGANLLYAEERFGRLAASIGTTSDTLMNDLRAAMKGTASDAQIVAGAGDLMALGLAKTHNEVLRLTKVSAGLGMDMNQLVLTLTNQTTMRFDALGVSVAGFDEKVKKLKDTGMDANAAFQEAFLQQAEEQLAKVGDKADSAAGAFMRLTAEQDNYYNSIKQRTGPALGVMVTALTKTNDMSEKLGITWMQMPGPLGALSVAISGIAAALNELSPKSEILSETSEEVAKTSKTYGEYVEEMIRAGKASGLLQSVQREEWEVYENNATALDFVTKRIGLMSEAQWRAAQSSDTTSRAQYGLSMAVDQTRQYYAALDKQLERSQAAEQYAQKMRALKDEMNVVSGDIMRATLDLRDAQQSWADSTGNDVARALEEAGFQGDEYKTALAAIDDMYGTSLGVQQQYKDDLKAAVAEFKKTGDVEAFKGKLGELKDTYMRLDDSIKKATDKLWHFKLIWDSLQSKSLTLTLNGPGGGSGGSGGSSGPKPSQGEQGLDSGAPVIYDTGGEAVIGGRRAAGGPVSGYIVNESAHTRPETTVLGNRRGQVLTKQQAMDALGAGGGVNINGPITVIANDPETFLRQMQALGRRARQAQISGAQYQGA